MIKQKTTATAIALLLSLGLVSTAFAQNGGDPTLNGTVPASSIPGLGDAPSGNQTTTTEQLPEEDTGIVQEDTGLTGNESLPQEPIPFPQGLETSGNETAGNETAISQNLTQVKEEAIDLLDTAETNIQDARDLIQSLQEALAQAQAEDEIVDEANQTADEIIDIVKDEVNDTAIVDQVGNITEDVVDVINDTVQSAPNATVDQTQNVSESVVDIIDEVTDDIDNSTAEAETQSAMIRLLTGLVESQNYNQNLTQTDRDNLKADLQETIADLADDAADTLRVEE